MQLTEAREGRSQTEVLAAIAEFQRDEDHLPRQRDITDALPISKGAVSNNCGKLLDADLIMQEEDRYRVNDEKLLDIYKERVDAHLVREQQTRTFGTLADQHNTVRTATKQDLHDTFEHEETRDLLRSILLQALIDAKTDSRIQTLREVLYRADQLVRKTAEHIVTSDGFDGETDAAIRALFRIAVSLNRTHEQLEQLQEQQPMLKEYFPGSPAETAMIDSLGGEH